jgi:hypothetical protein
MRRVATFSLSLALLLASCASDGGTNEAGSVTSAKPGATPSGTGKPLDTNAKAADEVKLPKPGTYVYDFVGRGDTDVPEGARLTEKVATSGKDVTVDLTNSENENSRRFTLRWEADRVLQLSIVSNIGGRQVTCTFDPPLVLTKIPIRVEKLPTQTVERGSCAGKIDIKVVGREEVADATGRDWLTWRIDTVTGANSESRWLSPELGRDIRTEVKAEGAGGGSTDTATILRSYPS